MSFNQICFAKPVEYFNGSFPAIKWTAVKLFDCACNITWSWISIIIVQLKQTKVAPPLPPSWWDVKCLFYVAVPRNTCNNTDGSRLHYSKSEQNTHTLLQSVYRLKTTLLWNGGIKKIWSTNMYIMYIVHDMWCFDISFAFMSKKLASCIECSIQHQQFLFSLTSCLWVFKSEGNAFLFEKSPLFLHLHTPGQRAYLLN